MAITKEVINERQKTLIEDAKNVQTRISDIKAALQENENLLQALIGASQQCDHFLKEIHNEESDVENSSEED